jgi:hypothetical protein
VIHHLFYGNFLFSGKNERKVQTFRCYAGRFFYEQKNKIVVIYLYSLGILSMDKQLLRDRQSHPKVKEEDPSKLAEVLNSLTEKESEQVYYTWNLWARPKQLVKETTRAWPESVVVYSMGRGGGKPPWLRVDQEESHSPSNQYCFDCTYYSRHP